MDYRYRLPARLFSVFLATVTITLVVILPAARFLPELRESPWLWPLTVVVATAAAMIGSTWATWRIRQPLRDLEEKHNDLRSIVRRIMIEKGELELILASMSEAVIVMDANERILRCNRAANELLGIDTEVARNRLMNEVVRHDALNQFISRVWTSSKKEEEELIVDHNGELRLHASGTPIFSDEGERIATLFVLHDVTLLRRLERVRQDFVANVSHELRTPITSIKGFVETLQDGAVDNLHQRDKFLLIIARQVDRLDAIIQDLTSLSRFDARKRQETLNIEPTSLAALTADAVLLCQSASRERSITVETSVPDSLIATVNPALMEQVVVNLLENAIKYSEPGKRVQIRGQQGPDGPNLKIIDEGVGISGDHLSRIFERFYRIDKGRSRKHGGTGLGLSIVKHIIQVHEASIDVTSTPGQGSTFTLTLPGH
jgi:two-component system, OmpR family, phosphate regulon sensor histidine kinase PhoR